MGLFGWLKPKETAFAIEWPPQVPGCAGEVHEARVLITDVPGLTADQVRQAFGATGPVPGRAVVISPPLAESGLELVRSGEVLGVRATAVGDQRMDDLLADVALATGGRVICSALGAGLDPDDVAPADARAIEEEGLVLPGLPWAGLAADDLGRALRVEVGDDRAVFHVREHARTRDLLRLLAVQHELAPTPAERLAVAMRFRRFGGPEDARMLKPGAVPELHVPDGAVVVGSGYVSPYFVTDPERAEARVEMAHVLISGAPLVRAGDVAPALRCAVRAGRPLAVVAPVVESGALAMLVVNKLRGVAPGLAVACGGSAAGARDPLTALCDLTGARAIAGPEALAEPEPSMGQVGRVTASRTVSVFSGSRSQGT